MEVVSKIQLMDFESIRCYTVVKEIKKYYGVNKNGRVIKITWISR